MTTKKVGLVLEVLLGFETMFVQHKVLSKNGDTTHSQMDQFGSESKRN